MRPTRLSMRLGLTVTAMSAFLVLVMAAFAYATIAHQLDLRAKDGLGEKLQQIEHSLAESSITAADIVLHCSGQLIPDTVLSFSSVFAGANPSLN